MPQESALEKLERLRRERGLAPGQGQQEQQQEPERPPQTLTRLFTETLKHLIPNPVQIAEQVGYAGGVGPFAGQVWEADKAARAEMGERGQELLASTIQRGTPQDFRVEGATHPTPYQVGEQEAAPRTWTDTAISAAQNLPVVGGVAALAGADRNAVEGAGNVLASSFPLVGTGAGVAGETIPQDPVGGLAQGLAQVLPIAAGPAVRAIKTTRAEPFGALPFASEVPLTISQQTSGFIAPILRPITARAESFLERSSFSAGPAARRLRVVKQRITKGAQALFDDIATPRTGNVVGIGEDMVEKTKAFVTQAKKDASDAIEVQLRQKFATTTASRRSLQVQAKKMLAEAEPTLTDQGGILRESLFPGDLQTLRDIVNANPYAPLPVIHAELSKLKAIARKGAGTIDTPDIGMVRQLSARAHKAMIAAARKSKGKAAAQELDDTLGAWRELHEMADGAVQDIILSNELRPEAIGPLLMRAGSGTIKQARATLPDNVYKAAVREGLQDLWNRSTVGESAAADAAQITTRAARRVGGFGDEVVENFDPAKFERALEGIGRENVRILVGTEGQMQLNQLASFTKKATRPGGLSDISERLRAPQLLAASSDGAIALGFLFGRHLQSAGAGAAINALGRIWFRTKTRRSFMAAARMVSNGNMRGTTWFLSRVQEGIERESPTVADREESRR